MIVGNLFVFPILVTGIGAYLAIDYRYITCAKRALTKRGRAYRAKAFGYLRPVFFPSFSVGPSTIAIVPAQPSAAATSAATAVVVTVAPVSDTATAARTATATAATTATTTATT